MFKSQHNAWIHLLAIAVVIGLGWYLRINTMEWTALVFAIGLVLVAELCNTSIEYLGDAVTEENNDKIKNAKDVSAGAVLMAAILAVVIACFVLLPKILILLTL